MKYLSSYEGKDYYIDTDYLMCPTCQSQMWNNVGRKTNPKGPDFVCKNKNCTGGILNGVPSPLALWIKQEPASRTGTPPGGAPRGTGAPQGTRLPPGRLSDAKSPKTMILAYSKDIVVALINQGLIADLEAAVAQTKAGYDALSLIINE